MIQLHHIATMSHNPEITALLLKVAGEIQAEIDRLQASIDPEMQMPMPRPA